MHAIGLIELAATFVRHCESQLVLRQPMPKGMSQSFWLECRFRHVEWIERLAAHRDAIQLPGVSYRQRQWLGVLPVLQEILLAEPLARCLTYHATALDELRIDSDFVALTQSALAAHIEARHRCLHLIVFGNGLSIESAVKLNRLRKCCEAINDQLLDLMHPSKSLPRLRFQASSKRAVDSLTPFRARGEAYRRMRLTSLTVWFRAQFLSEMHDNLPCSDETQQLVSSICGLLPQNQFDHFGLPYSKLAANILAPSGDWQAPLLEDEIRIGNIHSPLDLLHHGDAQSSLISTSHRRW